MLSETIEEIKFNNKQISVGSSVFPAGVEESDKKRGAPKNQARRETRCQRKTLARRGISKAKLRKFLMDNDWMPSEPDQITEAPKIACGESNLSISLANMVEPMP